jgi:L-aminopeptidase/D-esterase-like protein
MSPSLGPGFRVGHWTHPTADTGCTVILPPPGNVTSCDVRGSSPSTRELEHLHPDRRLTEVHAVLLTGGSAFGLAAAEGVMAWLWERDIGYQTGLTPIPIVPAAVIFDRAAARPDARPSPEHGRAACDAASSEEIPTGLVGAGAGATVGKWAGREHAVAGGLGLVRVEAEGHWVGAVAVANSVGDVIAADGSVLAGTTAPSPGYGFSPPGEPKVPASTVLALVATAARVDKREARWLAARGSDGITLSVRPSHTRYDGDVVFAVVAPPGEGPAGDLDLLGRLATDAVAGAVRAAVARTQ